MCKEPKDEEKLVPAAEAKKAGRASDDTRLTPKPPSLIGRLAWSHWVSVSDELAIRSTANLNSLSKSGKAGWESWETEGEQRSRWSIFGALKEPRSKIRASWAPIWLSLLDARESSAHRSDQAWSSDGPGKSGAFVFLFFWSPDWLLIQ